MNKSLGLFNSVMIDLKYVKSFKSLLENDGYFDKSKTIKKVARDVAAIPIFSDFVKLFCDHCASTLETIEAHRADAYPLHDSKDVQYYTYKDFKFSFSSTEFSKNRKLPVSPREVMHESIQQLISGLDCCESTKEELSDSLQEELPNHWEIHGSLVMLPEGSFRSNLWNLLGNELWSVVAGCLKVEKVARRSAIQRDGHRTPSVQLLCGSDGWVQHKDNGVRYTYDVTKCMFSSGNITEKLRVGTWNCEEETVVDLYAGIGYFTLPYLVHAKALHVHACEWNPDAVIALKKNLALNQVADRCTVYEGDNKKVCPEGVADRVNLGLIPSSEGGWRVACRALKPLTGGTLHIHENVHSTATAGTGCAGKLVSQSAGDPESTVSGGNSETRDKEICRLKSHNQTELGHKGGSDDNFIGSDANDCVGDLRSKHVNQSNVNHELVNHANVNQNNVNHDNVNHGNVNHGNVNQSNVNHDNVNHRNVNHGSVNHDNVNHGNVNHGNVNHGDVNHDNVNHGNVNHGNVNHGNVNHGSVNHGSVNHGNVNHGNVNYGLFNEKAVNCEALNHCSVNRGSLKHCPSKQETMKLYEERETSVGGSNMNTTESRTFLKRTKVKEEWTEWAERTSVQIRSMLIDIYKSDWRTEILHIEHVKSYAPHIDHIVLDLRCIPES